MRFGGEEQILQGKTALCFSFEVSEDVPCHGIHMERDEIDVV